MEGGEEPQFATSVTYGVCGLFGSVRSGVIMSMMII